MRKELENLRKDFLKIISVVLCDCDGSEKCMDEKDLRSRSTTAKNV